MINDLKVGDTIVYGDNDFKHKDIIERDSKSKKYYGVYLTNKARSNEFKDSKDLLDSYLNFWEHVKVVRDGKEYILKDFLRDLETIKENGYIILSENITDFIKIEILRIQTKHYFEKEKVYLLQYENEKLVKYKRIRF